MTRSTKPWPGRQDPVACAPGEAREQTLDELVADAERLGEIELKSHTGWTSGSVREWKAEIDFKIGESGITARGTGATPHQAMARARDAALHLRAAENSRGDKL